MGVAHTSVMGFFISPLRYKTPEKRSQIKNNKKMQREREREKKTEMPISYLNWLWWKKKEEEKKRKHKLWRGIAQNRLGMYTSIG